MTTRRGFLKGLGIVLAAPAIVRAESLMKLAVPKKEIIINTRYHPFDELIDQKRMNFTEVQPMYRHIVHLPLIQMMQVGEDGFILPKNVVDRLKPEDIFRHSRFNFEPEFEMITERTLKPFEGESLFKWKPELVRM